MKKPKTSKKKSNKIIKILFLVSLILLPFTCFFYSRSLYHGSSLHSIFLWIFLANVILSFIFFVLLFLRRGFPPKVFLIAPDTLTITCIAVGICLFGLGFDLLLYGDYSAFREFVITKSMNSLHYQDIATYLYPDSLIEKVVNKNMVQDPSLMSDLIVFDEMDYTKTTYVSKEEEEIFTKDSEDQIYKIIPIEGTNSVSGTKYTGYMAVIYDPSKVTLAVSPGVGETREGTYGQTLLQLARNNDALVAMNAGGFYDPDWNSNGGIPHGPLIHNGEIVTNFRRGIETGGIVGLTYDNRLILGRMSTEEAIEAGVRDAVDWGPYLIVNGVNQQTSNSYLWETCRTAIGQRKDGIILMVVISGHPSVSSGTTYKDLALLFERYGAYNAAVMDSGASTSMVENGKHLLTTWNGNRSTYRALPNAWIVTE